MQPIECAIEQVRSKAFEVFVLSAGFYRNKYIYDEIDKDSLSNLMMILKGIADAGVNGGVAVYLNTFFGDNDFAKEEFNIQKGPELRDAIIDQIRVLRFGLNLYNAMVEDKNAKNLAISCVESAQKMIAVVKESIGEFDITKKFIISVKFFNFIYLVHLFPAKSYILSFVIIFSISPIEYPV